MELTEWRENILKQLRTRNKRETYSYQDLIAQHNKIFEYENSLRNENLQLSIQNERLRSENPSKVPATVIEKKLQDEIQLLKQKLLNQTEELAELHKRKGENAQQIIDLNVKVQEKDKLIATKDVSLAEARSKIASLKAEIGMLTQSRDTLEQIYTTLKDEYDTLQLTFNALQDKLRRVQNENSQLVKRLMEFKAKEAERTNEENDSFLKKRYAKVQKDLEEACRDPKASEDLQEGFGPLTQSTLPTRIHVKFDAHDGEVNAVKWSPVDRLVATGGADRKVKLWDISKGIDDEPGLLVGSNAGIMAVDFDAAGSLVLGASNDFATRVWTVADRRLRHTLTGHSGKVLAAKFLGDASKVVTGSHDRTLKIWDLRSKACIETKFAGSSCNDLVTVDNAGSTIISGHFDKSVRFWDSRSETSANNIVLNGKVTSLDLARDSKYLLACVRDDTLKLIDMRMNQVVKSFSCDGFKVGCDWSRATFSPDAQYVAVGSADGNVYIWAVTTGEMASVLKEHGSAVTATSWHPYGSFLASVDRSKRAVIWAGDL